MTRKETFKAHAPAPGCFIPVSSLLHTPALNPKPYTPTPNPYTLYPVTILLHTSALALKIRMQPMQRHWDKEAPKQ